MLVIIAIMSPKALPAQPLYGYDQSGDVADWGSFQRFQSKFGLDLFNDTIVISVLSLVDHTSIQKAGCCHNFFFTLARSLLAHFRCRVCLTDGLPLTAFPKVQREFQLSTSLYTVFPWRCYQCGLKKEAENINQH